jgi:hypothetical protein
MSSTEGVDANTPAGIMAIAETVTYYLNLRLSAKERHVEVAVPAAVDQIVELASGLPLPSTQNWASLAVGKMPKEAKAKAVKPEGEGSRSRGKWTDATKEELVKMVEDDDFRTEMLGADATHNGHPNWSALARRYGFSGVAPVHRQYQAITNKDPPGIKAKTAREAGEGGEPAAKKAKKESNGAGPSKSAAAATATATADGWTSEECEILVKLVEDATFRKAQTGKKKLKWSKIADNIGKHKKESKKKYTLLTGKEAPESE